MIQQATEHFGQIDIVINNALVNFKFDPTQQKAFKDLTWEDYEQQLNGTLKGAFNVTQSVISQFIAQQSGCIISIGTNLYQNPVVPYHGIQLQKQDLSVSLVILQPNLVNSELQQMLFQVVY
ncbi:3-ketoacyl-ACP reductase [Staphylococcus saccharolyticus]|jgi:3-oxoacyl-(acyl-carrier-protein) reductase, putative|uniref:3-ketoacyl-ACP reductase n=1 Tax=Staphylococcus saccharolyticus TaxID=33028 RepID=A0A380HA93_9STAP|nr:3-ketoacyl-ACP reductase [Staphylococcus saccharolyticus]